MPFEKMAVRSIVLIAVGFAATLLLVAGFLPGGLALYITRVDTDDPIAVVPLEPGERFTLHYTHSVENAPIWEVHSLDDAGRIYIEEERYLKFGAGMGRMPGVGRMVKRGPYEVIEDMHMPTGNFVLRVGSPEVDHTLMWRGIRLNLSNRVPHEAIRFSARPVSLLYKWYRLLIPHPCTPGKD